MFNFRLSPDNGRSDDHGIVATTIRRTCDKMRAGIGLPGDRQPGAKFIRRSMSTGPPPHRRGELAARRNHAGPVPFAISDIYISPDPANLGLALRSTQEIIDEIEALAPALTATIPRGQMHHARSDGVKTSDFSGF